MIGHFLQYNSGIMSYMPIFVINIKNLQYNLLLMKKVIILFSLLATLQSFCQVSYQIADTTKMWNTLQFGLGSNMVHLCGGTYTHKITDVFPNDEYMEVMECFDSLQQTYDYIGDIREEPATKRVFFRLGEGLPEGLLYNFNLQVGDTVHVVNYYFNYEIGPMICDSIDQVEIDGELKNRLYLNREYYNIRADVWIEGIGSTYGLMYSGMGAANFAGGRNLLCCSKAGNTIWMDSLYLDCYIDAFYPKFMSHTFDTAYLGEYYEYQLQIDTGDADSIEIICGTLTSGLTYDPITGIISGIPTQLGNHNTIVTAENLQYGFLTDMIHEDLSVVLPTSTRVIDQAKKIRVYPNPFISTINLELTDEAGVAYSIEIYNPQGILIHQEPMRNSLILNLTHLKKGLYFLRVKDADGNLLAEERIIK